MPLDIRARNNVTVRGAGTQPMLFAHGFGCDQNMWRFITPAFEPDYRVILFDYVGSGKSDWSAYDLNRYGSLDGYVRDVLDICHELDLRDVIFVGHSVSSMVGVLAANKEPERFARLILVDFHRETEERGRSDGPGERAASVRRADQRSRIAGSERSGSVESTSGEPPPAARNRAERIRNGRRREARSRRGLQLSYSETGPVRPAARDPGSDQFR
jgi:pimeloyl-ACP methyl ester carboxylesterase